MSNDARITGQLQRQLDNAPIRTKEATDAYRERWQRVFGKKPEYVGWPGVNIGWAYSLVKMREGYEYRPVPVDDDNHPDNNRPWNMDKETYALWKSKENK